MEQFEDKLRNYKEAPANHLWQRVDNKLEHLKNKRRIKKFRNLSIAASLVAVFSVLAVTNLYLKQYNPKLFTTSRNFEPFHMEELNAHSDSMYELSKMVSLNNFYKSRAN